MNKSAIQVGSRQREYSAFKRCEQFLSHRLPQILGNLDKDRFNWRNDISQKKKFATLEKLGFRGVGRQKAGVGFPYIAWSSIIPQDLIQQLSPIAWSDITTEP